jgi:radical SAM superfamily enzyme with C-terminal helix-hairpin-helix motif
VDLHADEHAIIEKALDIDFPKPRVWNYVPILLFERTSLGLRDQELHVTGRLLDHFDKSGDGDRVPIKALYRALFRAVVAKTGNTVEFTSIEDFFEKKTLSRADVSALFARAIGKRRFQDSWPIVERELVAAATSADQIRIKTACLRYLTDRAGGEAAATQLSAMARAVIAERKAEIASYSRILDIVEAIRPRLHGDINPPYQGHALQGALIVEAYEALDG